MLLMMWPPNPCPPPPFSGQVTFYSFCGFPNARYSAQYYTDISNIIYIIDGESNVENIRGGLKAVIKKLWGNPTTPPP